MDKKKFILFDIDYTLFDTETFKSSALQRYSIYEEVEAVLMQLKQISLLGIFSKGENEFQKTKLKKTGLIKFFAENNIHIFVDKDANLTGILKKYQDLKLFLVDDKLDILFSAKKNMPEITTVWVKRGPFALKQKPIEDFAPDVTIDNLSNLFNIVSSK
jgi:phosphoglycolate phosphatase-like HAD superfamily hydrolase